MLKCVGLDVYLMVEHVQQWNECQVWSGLNVLPSRDRILPCHDNLQSNA